MKIVWRTSRMLRKRRFKIFWITDITGVAVQMGFEITFSQTQFVDKGYKLFKFYKLFPFNYFDVSGSSDEEQLFKHLCN